MNNTLQYKGYTGIVQFDADDRIFYGRIIGIQDIVGFEGTGIDELEKDFRDSVDDYLETCSEIGKIPEKPFSAGRVIVELPPDLHIAIAEKACQEQRSIDSWIADACRKMISDQVHSDPARKAA